MRVILILQLFSVLCKTYIITRTAVKHTKWFKDDLKPLHMKNTNLSTNGPSLDTDRQASTFCLLLALLEFIYYSLFLIASFGASKRLCVLLLSFLGTCIYIFYRNLKELIP